MGEINLSIREKEALKAIDPRELDRVIDRAIDEQSVMELRRLRLADCGPFVTSKLTSFESAIRKLRDAKSARKVAETHQSALRAGYALSHAFGDMVGRMKAEERFDEFFYVDDDGFRPHHYHPAISIRVPFRWRKAVDEPWTHGAITFTHVHEPRPSYGVPAPKRKPSAAKQAEALQEAIAHDWDHLYRTALYTVRDFFQGGGDGSTIPKSFKAVTDSQGHLNNLSAQWWKSKPSDAA